MSISGWGKVAAIAAGPIAVVAAGALVFQGSYSAFENETRNAGNTWGAGTVSLTNDSAGVAAFSVSGMIPGQTGSKCIVVTAAATVPSVVKFYLINPTETPTSGNLEGYVNLKVEEGTGGSFSSCTGFTASSTIIADQTLYAAATTYDSWAHAAGGGWTGVTTGTKTYKFTWTMSATPPQSVQGQHFGIDFEWEMQNTG